MKCNLKVGDRVRTTNSEAWSIYNKNRIGTVIDKIESSVEPYYGIFIVLDGAYQKLGPYIDDTMIVKVLNGLDRVLDEI